MSIELHIDFTEIPYFLHKDILFLKVIPLHKGEQNGHK